MASRAPAGAAAERSQALPMDDSLFFKLVRVVNLTARPFNESFGRANRISLTQWRVMIVLASHPGIAAHEVAFHTGLDKMSVSRAIAGLVRRGRIVRREDPADKRRVLLALSAAGERVYERIGAAAKTRETSLFAAIGAGERARLARTLDKLIAHRLAADLAS